MSYLIIPAIDTDNTKPKWLKTHPNSKFMITEAISGIDIDQHFDKVYFVFHSSYKNYNFQNGLQEELAKLFKAESSFLFLDELTKSQPETVYAAITKWNLPLDQFVFVKDADNYFTTRDRKLNIVDNQILYYDLKNFIGSDLKNKCYIKFTKENVITNVVEKNIISSTFSIGGYGFQTADKFCKYFNKLPASNSSIYMSNIFFEMMLNGEHVYANEGIEYLDWGTDSSWREYINQYKTIFLDIDGVLVENTSAHFPPGIGHGTPLSNNIAHIKNLVASKKVKIILTTSRPESYRDITTNELINLGIPIDTLIMGLPHCQRIVVNDFAPTNPYPACSAINIPRNSNNLHEYLR